MSTLKREWEIRARHADSGTFTRRVVADTSALASEMALELLSEELRCEEEELGILKVADLGEVK